MSNRLRAQQLREGRGGRFGAIAVLLGVLVAAGCDKETPSPQTPRDGPAESVGSPKPAVEAAWEPAEVVELEGAQAEAAGALALTEPEKFPPCHEVLSKSDGVAETFPLGADEVGPTLIGCGVEAYHRDEHGRWLAWSVGGSGEDARDLQVAAYDAEDRLRWTWRMDRSRFAEDFQAHFRASFIATMWPRLVCVGTLWEARTQAGCLEAKTGAPEWDGVWDFWAALPFVAFETSLAGADISGITRRYPYSGVEMRRREFAELGGHSALYATDGRRLFFVPRDGKGTHLTAWSFATMNPEWRIELPERPDTGFDARGFGRHDLLVLKIGDTLHGLDAATGRGLWAVSLEDRKPSIAVDDTAIHILGRRDEGANGLWSLAPRDGEVLRRGTVPSGLLNVHTLEGTVVLQAVRAVQTLKPASDGAGGSGATTSPAELGGGR